MFAAALQESIGRGKLNASHMDELITFLTRTNDLWDHYKLTRRTDLDVSELRQQLNGQHDITVLHRLIRQDETAAWLNRELKVKDPNPVQSVLRLVWIKHCINEQIDDISADTLTHVLDAFELRRALDYSRTTFAGVTVLPSTGLNDKSSNDKQTFAVSIHPKLNLLWSYNSSTHTTYAVCFGTEAFISKFKAALDAKWSFSAHPMFPAFICSIVLANEIDHDQNSIKREVRETEVRTGFHRWTGRPERPAPGDLSVLSAHMSGCSTKMASVERKAAVVEELHRLIVEQIQRYDTPTQVSLPTSDSSPQTTSSDSSDNRSILKNTPSTSSLDQLLRAHSRHPHLLQQYSSPQPQPQHHPPTPSLVSTALTSATTHLTTRLHLSNVDTTFIRARITTQQTALAHLITQNDTIASQSVAQDSRTLAIASHRDSSSMKTLAVVTMFFLPGTFVASLFAMPFFGVDNDNDNRRVRVSRDFGVYWAVTVPLTVAVMGLWVFWTVWRGWRDERVDRVERSRVRRELAGSRGVRSVGSWNSEKNGADWTVDVDGDGDGVVDGDEGGGGGGGAARGRVPEIGSLVRKRTALERQMTR